MNIYKKSLLLLFAPLLVALASPLNASVRMSTTGYNDFDTRTRFLTTGGFALPDGDWTIGLWENNWSGDGGRLINTGTPNGTGAALSLFFDKVSGGYVVGGRDVNGAAFGSVTATIVETTGTLPGKYRARITGKFTPRLHIIRRRSGFNEYLVAEAGNAPVLVFSEQRPFAGFPARNWNLACWADYKDMYDGDLEGFFMASVAATNQDISLMAAGWKPSSIPALSGNLPVYFPMETAQLSSTVNPTKFINAGSATTVGLDRMGPVSKYGDGPMLRGAITENTTPGQVTEPSNVVVLNNFQQFQVIRHLNGSATVPFTGFDYGVGTANIEIRFHDVEHGTSTPWQTLVSGSVGGGAPINTTLSIPKGYWRTSEVRRVNSPSGTGNSSRPNRSWSRWAVGEVVVVWGDSIQGQVENAAPMDTVIPNGFIAKYPSTYPKPVSSNPLASATWNLLHGTGMGGGTQAENEMANRLSDASQCCVGITVVWAGATSLNAWADGGQSYQDAKALTMANGGLNKPNIFTWVANLASAKASRDFYADLNNFKARLNSDYTEGTWRLVLAPGPIIYSSEVTPVAMHKLREQSTRWVRDNPSCGSYAGLSVDYLTYDGVHPQTAAWDIMAPRWGNALAYIRDAVNYADPRAGEITKFYRSGNTLLVEVQLYAGTALSLKTPTAKISGLSLSADDFVSMIAIDSTTMVNATTFRITPPAGTTLPTGPLKLRYLYGRPGTTGTTLAQVGVDNILYVNAGPTNIVAVQPILGTLANNWSLLEDGASPTSPEINVTGNAVGIADGDTTPGIADATDFGSVNVASGSVTTTYTIQNQGTAALTVNPATLSGTNAADFAILTQPATSVAAGGTTTFSVRFDPSAAGTRMASVSFGNNDASESPYNFSVQGTGSAVTQEVILDNKSTTGVTISPQGGWSSSTAVAGYYSDDYIHDGGTAGGKSVRFTPTLPATGNYDVSLWWTGGAGRASNTPIDVITSGTPEYLELDQTVSGSPWRSVGVFHFNAGTTGSVLIGNTGADGSVIVDAIRFTLVAPPLVNPSFETDAAGSQSITGWTESGTVTASSVSSTVTAQSGTKYLGVWQSTAYSEFTSQTMTSLPNGLYTLKAWTQRSVSGYVAQMEATPGGGTTQAITIPPGNTTWTQVTIANISVTDGTCTIGFRSTSAPGGAALRIDSVEFYKQ